MTRAVSLLLLALFSGVTLASTQPVVRATLTPTTVTVGQPVELSIVVLVPTWFTKPPVFPSFEITNAITRLPPDSSYPTSERIGNDTWSGIVRKYTLYPLMKGDFVISGEMIRVHYADPGKAGITVDVAVPDNRLTSTVPAGAESLSPYLAGTRLDLNVNVLGDAAELETGDAVVLEYRAELDGLPAMFLPPLAPEISLEGVSVYRDQPVLSDGDGAKALRSEKITLVFEAGGSFTVPAISLDYYDLDSKAVATTAAPPVTLSVSGPAMAPQSATSTSAKNRFSAGIIALLFAATIMAIGLLWRLLSPVARKVIASLEDSETLAFRRLCRHLKQNRVDLFYPSLHRWLHRLAPGIEPDTFFQRFGGERLATEITSLRRSLYGKTPQAVDTAAVLQGLETCRAHYRREQKKSRLRQGLQLNP
ncbi:conserved hypothetical protein [Luminiphilus syltensis NOR5-1B]|uniref:BatD protein n=1 Tax=Luminiphilus syltensis NOR5-1B TaxID=565045 RepID=B8KRD5_9GAMM|nr:BatD family protein [Luminiphilus syltensis]EED34315.1 conserved hypothetical protein [Luminiphilus syltensis NOR5-1B]